MSTQRVHPTIQQASGKGEAKLAAVCGSVERICIAEASHGLAIAKKKTACSVRTKGKRGAAVKNDTRDVTCPAKLRDMCVSLANP